MEVFMKYLLLTSIDPHNVLKLNCDLHIVCINIVQNGCDECEIKGITHLVNIAS